MSVAIIGGGPSGLVSVKEARECGLCPTLFEQGRSIGGIWKSEGGKVWDNLRTNNSRYNMSFSDHDWDKTTEDFPNGKKVFEYLCEYAEKFDLHKHVKLRCKVTKIERSGHKWSVEWLQKQTKESSLFDYLIVASGFCSRGYFPEIPGIKNFPGSVTHSEDYKNPNPFREKVVAVVGNAFSGAEIASEIAEKSKQVFHLYRTPKWITSRYIKEEGTERSAPFDLVLLSRDTSQIDESDPSVRYEKANRHINFLCREQKKMCPDLPTPPVSDSPPFITISDTYHAKVKEGTVVPMLGTLERIEGDTLVLSENRTIAVDHLIFCTGFRTELRFFDSQMQEQLNFQEENSLLPLPLYKTVFHPKFPRAAFVGMHRFGIYFGLIELQARWASMTFSGNLPCASEEEMQQGIQEEVGIRNRKKRPQFPFHNIRLGDSLAKIIGVLPDFTKMKAEKPKFHERLWSGPFTTTSYRLTGPGNNPSLFSEIMDEISEKMGSPLQSPQYCYQNEERKEEESA